MKSSKILDVVLWALLAFGFLGGLKISYENLTGNACPHIGFVPICYIVTIAYGLMIASVLIRHNGCKHYLFAIGWAAAFIIALVGSIAEIALGGGVCPAAGGSVRGTSAGSIPLCFASLAMCLVILALFLIGPWKRACDTCNAPSA